MTTEKQFSPDELAENEIEIAKVSFDGGGYVYIGSLTAEQFVEWSDSRSLGDTPEARTESKKLSNASLIVRSLVKGENDPTRIGTTDMIQKFKTMKLARSEKILKAIFKLNGIGNTDTAVKNG